MSAEITKARVQECIRAALADEVAAIGGVSSAAQECGISDDSVRRRLAGTHAWSVDDLAAMTAAGHARLGRSLPHQRLGHLLTSAVVVSGDARHACLGAASTLPALLAEAQKMASALADGEITRDEARALLADLPELTRRLDSLQADLAAILRSGRA